MSLWANVAQRFISNLSLFPKEEICCFCRVAQTHGKNRRDAQGSPPLLRSRAHASLSRSRKSSSRISLGENFRHSHSLKIKYLRSELFNHVNSERGETILLPYPLDIYLKIAIYILKKQRWPWKFCASRKKLMRHILPLLKPCNFYIKQFFIRRH